MISPLGVAVGFFIYTRRFINKVLNMCPFDYTVVAGSEKVWSVNHANYTSLVAVLTPPDNPRSASNRCIFERFGGVFVL